MTRVDVSDVAVGVRQDGTPVFRASGLRFIVDDKNALWFLLEDAKGNVFAIAGVDEDRAAGALTQIMIDMGGEIRKGRSFNG